MMADASARLTGRPGIAFVTRGPGATNAMPAIHIAEHDDVPLILFIGQVGREMRERGAFQEMNYRALFGSTTKWATEIDDPARIPEIVSRAFHVAMQGRPGPVVIALPEDMLTEQAAVEDAARTERVETYPGNPRMAELQSQSYTLFEIPNPRQKLVHVHADAEELGRVYHPHLGINATPAPFCAALAKLQPPKDIAWADATRESRADYIAWTEKPS